MLSAQFSKSSGAVAVLSLALAVATGCDKKGGDAAGAPSAAASGGVAPTGSALGSYLVPVGPRLALLAGQGVGPIRLGATVETIERLMEAPCEEKTATLCRYAKRAVEFELGADGKTIRIHAHRMGRAAGGGKTYGVFNGGIPPDLQFGMIMPAVQEFLGPPLKVETGTVGAAAETAAQHHYQGMVVEYDRLPTGKLVLGGVRIPD